MIGMKIAAGVIGTLVIALGVTGLALKHSIADEAEAEAVRDETLAKNQALVVGLAKVTAENERRGKIVSRNRRQTNAHEVEKQRLRDELAAVARGAAPTDCINAAPPPAVRMLLSGRPGGGGAPAVRPGGAARATSGTADPR